MHFDTKMIQDAGIRIRKSEVSFRSSELGIRNQESGMGEGGIEKILFGDLIGGILFYMNTLKYNVIFRPEPEGGFTAIVPSLPGCVTYGEDLLKAKEMAIDAIGGYIESLKKHNEPVPSDDVSFISLVDIPNSKTVHA
jgi:antitoxin HicB